MSRTLWINATTMKSMNIKHTKKLFIGTSAICMYNKTPSSLAFGIGKDIWQWLLRKMASGNARQYYACDKRQFKYYWETPSPGLPDSNAKPRSPIVVSSNNQCLSRPSEKLSRLCLTSSAEIGLSYVCLLVNHLFISHWLNCILSASVKVVFSL